jgi:hypothetical protein
VSGSGEAPSVDTETLKEIDMSKTGFLAAAAVAALTAGHAWAHEPLAMGAGAKTRSGLPVAGYSILWNQNNPNTGTFVDSQNFTSGTFATYDDAGADDFVVPAGQTWTINELDVSGTYFADGSGPATSENVTFYKNKPGKHGAIDTPGNVVPHGAFTNLTCTDDDGDFSCTLPGYGAKRNKFLTLKAGHYWVSIVANCADNGTCGEWGWDQTTPITDDAAEWENPDNGFGLNCTSWNVVSSCGGPDYTGDFAFDLQGSSS